MILVLVPISIIFGFAFASAAHLVFDEETEEEDDNSGEKKPFEQRVSQNHKGHPNSPFLREAINISHILLAYISNYNPTIE
ncbi:hypothetical protein ACI5FR_13540 [Paenibacillus sp. HJGM_3]